MSKASEARAMRFGMLRASLTAVQDVLKLAWITHDLLSDEQRTKLAEAIEIVASLQQQIWSGQ